MIRRRVSSRNKSLPASVARAVAARPLLLLAFLLALSPLLPAEALAQPPAGFEDTKVAEVELPTAFAFLPDDSMLVTSKPGRLLLIDPATGDQEEVLDLSDGVCGNSERGLLGVAVDPDFGTGSDDFVYLYYTAMRGSDCPTTKAGPTNQTPVKRVSRFAMTGDKIERASEEILIDGIDSPQGNHNAGDLKFGPDKNLYVSVGDGGNGGTARDLGILNGKILRVERDGTIPADNPYASRGVRCDETGRAAGRKAVCQEVFARGLRNPFRIAFDPDAAEPSFFINDVGASVWEEVDRGRASANYGWDKREGPCPTGESRRCGKKPRRLTDPIHAYKHTSGCRSITGGAFVPNGAPGFDAYAGAYLYADFICKEIFALTPKGRGFERASFGETEIKPVAMGFGPDGALYYAGFGSSGGEIRKIAGSET